MSHVTLSTIPCIKLNQQSPPSDDQIQALGDSLKHWGFVNLVDHGVDHELLERGYQVAREVFSLAEDQKRACEDVTGGRQRGYTPFLVERAKGESQPDLKEFWHIGRSLSPEHPSMLSGRMRPNIYPELVPEFKRVMSELYLEMDKLSRYVLRMVALYLRLDVDRMMGVARDGNSVLRVLHYPDLESNNAAGKVRAAAHEDINLLTLLPAATRPGLELLTRDGEWLPVTPPEGAIICDTGDMMSALTGGILPATTHRVVNPEGGADGGRLSMPFFMHPHPNATLAPSTVARDGKRDLNLDGEALTAHEFLHRRLADNGLT